MAEISSNGNAARLSWVLVLPMTAFYGHQIPAISFNQPDDLTNFPASLSPSVNPFHPLTNYPCRRMNRSIRFSASSIFS